MVLERKVTYIIEENDKAQYLIVYHIYILFVLLLIFATKLSVKIICKY